MSLFRDWMTAMGFNGKQMTRAAEAIGAGYDALRVRRAFDDDEQLKLTERLAMSAVRAGLPEWSPEADAEIVRVRDMRKLMEAA